MAAARKTKNSTPTPAERQEKKKLRRGVILLTVLFILLVALGVAMWWLKHRMFEKNPRFTLKHIQVESSGYWGKDVLRRNALIRKLDLRAGQQNLFDLDLRKLRMQLKSLPNVADAQVCTQLPDTLLINIEERSPRAFLGRPNSRLVVDANAMVMNARECFGVHPRMPVIVGMPHRSMRPGVIHPALREALNLIMSVQRYDCFSVALVNLSRNGELFVLMDYRHNSQIRRYHVTMLTGNYQESLDILRSAIEDALRHGDDRTKINMSFKNQVVMSR